MLRHGGGASEFFQGFPGTEDYPARRQPSDTDIGGRTGRQTFQPHQQKRNPDPGGDPLSRGRATHFKNRSVRQRAPGHA